MRAGSVSPRASAETRAVVSAATTSRRTSRSADSAIRTDSWRATESIRPAITKYAVTSTKPTIRTATRTEMKEMRALNDDRRMSASSAPCEEVPDAADRLDDPCPAVSDLAAQVAHEDLDHVAVRAVLASPDALDELLASHRAAGVRDQVGEQVELLAGEVDDLPVDRHAPRRSVDLHAGRAVDGARRGALRPLEQRADPREQLRHLEGLAEVVVRAGVETLHHVGGVGTRGEHEDRNTVSAAAETGRDLEPVDAGQHQVQHDEVGTGRRDRLERRGAVGRPPYLEAVVRELELDESGDALVVLHQQDGRFRHLGVPHLPCPALQGQGSSNSAICTALSAAPLR